jgi:hypothetical protein
LVVKILVTVIGIFIGENPPPTEAVIGHNSSIKDKFTSPE